MLATGVNQHLAEMQVRMQTPCMVYTNFYSWRAGLLWRSWRNLSCQGLAAQGNGPENQSELMLVA